MILYHGTTTKYYKRIMEKGITPRGKRKGNWDDERVKSKKEFVYFTSVYPVYFAHQAVIKNGGDLLLLKVNLKRDSLYPDEDFIARGLNRSNEDLRDINPTIKLEDYKHVWDLSYHHNGIVAHRGIVSPRNIVSAAIIPKTEIGLIMATGGDSMPVPMNYKIMGGLYKEMINAIFKEKDPALVREKIKSLHQKYWGGLKELAIKN